MPIYISRGRFTSDAVKGMLAKPENREEAVAKLFKSVGGRLIGWYLTFGHHDWLAIGEFPDEKAAASAVLAAAAGGSLSDVETTVAMTTKMLQLRSSLLERRQGSSGAPDAPSAGRCTPETIIANGDRSRSVIDYRHDRSWDRVSRAGGNSPVADPDQPLNLIDRQKLPCPKPHFRVGAV